MTTRFKRPRDPVSRAKLIGDIATGQQRDAVEDKRDPVAVELGIKGGNARAESLTKEQRQAFARLAAKARWKK